MLLIGKGLTQVTLAIELVPTYQYVKSIPTYQEHSYYTTELTLFLKILLQMKTQETYILYCRIYK